MRTWPIISTRTRNLTRRRVRDDAPQVLDVARWLPEHPGGPSIIPQQALNVEAGRFFEVYHSSRESFTFLKHFYVGELRPEDRAEVPLPTPNLGLVSSSSSDDDDDGDGGDGGDNGSGMQVPAATRASDLDSGDAGSNAVVAAAHVALEAPVVTWAEHSGGVNGTPPTRKQRRTRVEGTTEPASLEFLAALRECTMPFRQQFAKELHKSF